MQEISAMQSWNEGFPVYTCLKVRFESVLADGLKCVAVIFRFPSLVNITFTLTVHL